MAEELLPPPTWDDIEKDEGYQKLTPSAKAETLTNWARYSRNYGDQNGWFNDSTVQDEFRTSTANKLKEIQALEPLPDQDKVGNFFQNLTQELESNIGNFGGLLVRGGTSEGIQMGAEGLFRAPAMEIASADPLREAETAVTDYEQALKNLESANQQRGFSTPESERQKTSIEQGLQDARIRLDAVRRPGTAENLAASPKGQQARQEISGTLEQIANEAASQRQAVREAIPVDESYQSSLPGQVAQGLGQLASLPAYAIPGVGPTMAVAQLYQEGYDDAIQSGASPEVAARAAKKYAMGAAPLEIIADKLLVGKVLKSVEGQTVKQAISAIVKQGAQEGASEGGQQLWLNAVAKELEGYQPDRRLTQDVINSAIVGGLVGIGGTVLGQAAGTASQTQDENRIIVEQAAVESENLRANNAPATADAVEQVAATEIAENSPESRIQEAISELSAGEEVFTSEQGDERFSPQPSVEAETVLSDSGAPAISNVETQEQAPEPAQAGVTPEPQGDIVPPGEAVGETPESEVQPVEIQEYGQITNQSSRSNPAISRRDASQQAQARNASLLQSAAAGASEDGAGASTGESSREAIISGIEKVQSIPAQERQVNEPAQPISQTVPQETQAAVGTSSTDAGGSTPVRRVQLRGTPQTFTVEEEIERTPQDIQFGESYLRVRNERTGETQIIEAGDIQRDVKPKSERVKKVVAALPANQQAKANAATEPSTEPDPYQGAPLTSSAPLSLEENIPLIQELSRYGIFDEDSSGRKVLEKIAANKDEPQWMRTLAERLLKLNLPEIIVEAQDRADSTWAGLKAANRIIFNLRRRTSGVAATTLHEASHMATLDIIRQGLANPESLTPAQQEAMDGLQAIFAEISALPEFQGEYGLTNLEEMVAEAFSNAGFRAKLQNLNPNQPPSSVWRRLVRWIAQLLTGRRVQPTSTLEQVIENAFTLAGSPIVEGYSGAPMREFTIEELKADRSYTDVSDQLLGFVGDGKQNRGFQAERYPYSLSVLIRFPNGDVISDRIKGQNPAQAMERARRNWPAAQDITPTSFQNESVAAMAEPIGWGDVLFNHRNASNEAMAKAYEEASQELQVPESLPKQEEPLTPAQSGYIESLGDVMPMLNAIAKDFKNIPGTDQQERVSEAVLGLVKAARTYNPEIGTFRGWANKIIAQQMINFRRKQVRVNRDAKKTVSANTPVSQDMEETEIIETLPSEEDITVQANDLRNLRQKAGEALVAAIKSLSERDQSILRDYASGMNYREVGARNGISHEGAKKVILRSRKAIENALFLRGINLEEVLNEPQERYGTAEPTAVRREEDEQAVQESAVGQLEAQDEERQQPIYDPELSYLEPELVPSKKSSWDTVEGGTDDPWDQTFIQNIISFQDIPNDELSPSTREKTDTLERGVKKAYSPEDPRAVGSDFRVRSQKRIGISQAKSDPLLPLKAESLNEFIDNFEKLTGKTVRFVRGENGTLPFSGAMISSDPNFIFINTGGNRNILALVGHEWAHSLERQDAELYRRLKADLLPYVDNWRSRVKEIKGDSYQGWRKQTGELTSNIVGDLFTDPDFWRYLRGENEPLFTRIWRSFNRFISNLVSQTRRSEWGTPRFINDLEAVRSTVADIFREAIRRGPYPDRSISINPDWQLSESREAQDRREFLPRPPSRYFTPASETIQSDDSSVAPMSPRGRETRTPILSPDLREKISKTPEGPYRPQGLFSAAGKWSQSLYDLLKQKNQSTRAALSRVEFIGNKFNRQLNDLYTKQGIPVPTEQMNTALGNTDNRLTKEQADIANRITDPDAKQQYILSAKTENLAKFELRQQAALDGLPTPIQESILEMRELIDNLSRRMIKDGDLTGDLRAAVDQNVGTYLHRSYQIFDGDQWNDFIRSDDPDATKIRNRAESLFEERIRAQKAVQYGRDMRSAGTPVSKSEAISAVQDLDVSKEVETMLNDYLAVADGSVIDTLRGRLPGQKNQSILKVRGDIPKEIRDLWGQYDDAAVNFAKTYASIATYLENQKFLTEVMEDGLRNGYLWKEGVSEGVRPSNYVEIVGSEGSRSLAPLAGVYGPPALRDAFQEAYNPQVRDWLGTLTTAAMKAKTVYSIGSIVRNFFGNPAFMLANGNVFTGDLGNAAKQTIANFRKLGTKEQRERISRYTELGVLGDNVGPSIIKELAEGSRKFSESDTPAKALLQWTADKLSGVRESFEGIYSGVDDFWKVYAFESELAKLKWANPEVPVGQLEQQAAEIVRNTVPTYSESPAVVRDLLKGKLGKFIAPFITFTTEVMRVTGGTVAQTARELKSSNPRERAIGSARLAGMITVASLPAILSQVSKAMFGYDDEDEEALRNALPDWQKNATILFLPRDSDGNVRFIDLSYLNPYNYFTDAATAASRSLGRGDSPEQVATEAIKGAAKQLLDPFLAEQIALGAYVDIARNQKANGAEVYNPQDTTSVKAQKIATRIAQSFTPGTVDSAGRIWKAGVGYIEPTGRAYDLGNEIMAPLLGQRINSYNPKQGLQFQTSRFNADRNDASQVFTRAFGSQGTIQPGEITDAYNRANDARYRIYRELRENYLGAMDLGLSRDEAIKTLKAKSAGNEAIAQVVRGEYMKYRPSDSAIRDVAAQYPERVQEFMQVYRNTPTLTPFPR